MKPGPLLLEPILKHRAWGGTALLSMGKHAASGEKPPFGESWELADLPPSIGGGRSRVVNGPFAGMTLHEAIAHDRDAASASGVIMGRAALAADRGFPLLVKFLDAAENLSIQVHPDAAYARRHPGVRVKSEAWIILNARAGACVYRGVDPALKRCDLLKLLDEDRLLDAVIRRPVRAGDCVRLPAGIAHALGAGIVAAEVQTPSDTTFRLWDWGRRDPARPLHREEALDCLLVGDAQGLDDIPIVNAASLRAVEADRFRTIKLCRMPEFEIEEIAVVGDGGDHRGRCALDVVTEGQPVVWIVLSGSARFEMNHARDAETILAGAWQTLLLPADSEGWTAHLSPGTRFLRVTLPDRMSRMLAGDG